MANCPKCRADGFKSFTFSNGDTVTRCRACGDESGHEALQTGSCKLPWTQEAALFDEMHEHLGTLGPAEIKMGEVVPASGAAKKTKGTVKIRSRVLVWDAARGRHFDRQVSYYAFRHVPISPPDLPVVGREIEEDLTPSLTVATLSSDLKRLAELRGLRKRSWKAFIFRKRMTAWKKAARKLREKDNSPFTPHHYAKVRARRRRPRLPQDWNVIPRIQKHESASCGAVEMTHTCGAECPCQGDWRPFTAWRPFDNPKLRRGDLDLLEIGFLSLSLTRLLRVFGGTYPHDPYKEKRLFFQMRVDAERRRFILRSWLNGVEQPPKFAKAYECWDFKPKRLGEKDSKVKVNLDYVIVSREKPREKSTKIPGYKTHDSWEAVMAYLGCSRRTAFRKIKEGFRIPVREAYETNFSPVAS